MGKTFKNRGHKDKPKKHSGKPTQKDNWKKYKGKNYEDSEV